MCCLYPIYELFSRLMGGVIFINYFCYSKKQFYYGTQLQKNKSKWGKDINGRILHNATLSKGQPVPIDHLPSGMYFIKLIRNKETVFLDKLSKL